MQERSHKKVASSVKRADKSGKLFPIVGIGASAGGLGAFTKLFEHLPSDTGMAFVLVQHLAPTHESLLSELISRVTAMPVSEVKDGMQVEPNHVYVIPPDTVMRISHGVLKLTPRDQTHGLYLPIDYFFRSLVEDDGGIAIGVVLSGTGSDGAEGLKAIKAQNGITFAQDLDSAEQDGMPKSASATGAVDFVMTPQEIAQELARLAALPYVKKPRGAKADELAPDLEAGSLNRIFAIIHTATGADFSQYKQATIKRRIARRMSLLKIEKLQDYVTYLQENPAEAQSLYQDILIKVTEFFRDPRAFEALKQEVFPQIVENILPEAPIRVWVPGCATGEEAYSIAISLLEFLENTASKHQIQIFATDINGVDLERARIGIYLERIKKEVSEERLDRFFERFEGGYRVVKIVREMVIFAQHDVTKDPPFSKLEFISFRNVLIYMQMALQARLIPMFHYALNPGGLLMLSPSETIGGFSDLFAVADSKHKIYSRKAGASKLPLGFTVPTFRAEKVSGVSIEAAHAEYDPLKEANQLILESYAPAGFLINSAMVILQFYGNTRPYLQPSIGKASLNLAKMIQKGLAPVLRTAINDAKKTSSPVCRDGLSLTYDNHHKTVDLEVVPIKDPAGEFYFVILFKDSRPPASISKETPRGSVETGTKRGSKNTENTQLRRELISAEDHLQSVIQEKDGAYEELQVTSEELQSSNEEMQSINEELETSKEELQSTNEELATVNQELGNRNAELTQALVQAEDAHDYAQGIVETVREPLIVLGRDLRVRTASHSFYKIFEVTPEETEGKLIFDLGNRQWDIPRLRELLEQTIPDKSQLAGFEVEHMFQAIGYKTMLLNARMIHQETHEPLILLAIEDITVQKQERRLRDALNDINAAITSTFDLNEILERVAMASTKAMSAESAAIVERDGDLWLTRYVYGRLPQEMLGQRFSDSELRSVYLAYKTKKPAVFEDAYSDEKLNAEVIRRLGIRSVISVPLVMRGVVTGAFSFMNHSAPAVFSDAEVDFVTKLAASLSLALENARLYAIERDIADTLQTAILTMPQRIEGIKFNHLYRSAAEAALVGGDFYDLFELEQKKIGIVIGDVAGKGIGAASLMSRVKNTIRAFSLEDSSPASIMAKTSAVIFNSTAPSDFVTVFFGILETSTGKLIYCDAGHPPAIIRRRDHSVNLLTDYSPIIGAFPDCSYTDSEINLGRGDTLILYTDGIIEARCDNGFYGEERLVTFIKKLEPVSAERLPQQIFDEVERCTGGKLSDDIAILAISRR
ncbi:MAG: chemotaxis protein CheB [Candidatus Aquicultor sp.]|nr:chemotaxis protein CheB [Candidatus Aquicultor sp.]